ncbi:hypothetical protein J6590_004440 [Homalodisca vitripennis]|nr:hypothetical protein J6590_004440 [Homalodisca vitripennis]
MGESTEWISSHTITSNEVSHENTGREKSPSVRGVHHPWFGTWIMDLITPVLGYHYWRGCVRFQENTAPEFQVNPSPEFQENTGPVLQENPSPGFQENTGPVLQENPSPGFQENTAPEFQENPSPEFQENTGPVLQENPSPGFQENINSVF